MTEREWILTTERSEDTRKHTWPNALYILEKQWM